MVGDAGAYSWTGPFWPVLSSAPVTHQANLWGSCLLFHASCVRPCGFKATDNHSPVLWTVVGRSPCPVQVGKASERKNCSDIPPGALSRSTSLMTWLCDVTTIRIVVHASFGESTASAYLWLFGSPFSADHIWLGVLDGTSIAWQGAREIVDRSKTLEKYDNPSLG